MNKITKLDVTMGGKSVGTLALARNGLIAFAYSDEWLETGFAISPFKLPLERKVFLPNYEPFEGLFGVFADSLPDGWGRLLVDRLLLRAHEQPARITPLQRLALVGSSGMGALEYYPEELLGQEAQACDLDVLASACAKVFRAEQTSDLDTLFQMGGSSGGARPKVLMEIEGEPWLIKFQASEDGDTIGREEYEYALCAAACGIEVSQVALFPSKVCDGYFGTKRFDRAQGRKKHVVTVSGLLETSHRLPSLDYHSLMKLTQILTRDSAQVEQMYRRMCFNVFAHNRDDHAKNFSYLYDTDGECWRLAPAYDMTYSSSLGGEHATCVDGNGANPSRKELFAVGRAAGLSIAQCKKIADEIQQTVQERLGDILREKI